MILLHHQDAPQQVGDDVLVLRLRLDQAAGQLCPGWHCAPEHSGLHRIQRQKGGPPCTVAAQQGNGSLGSRFVLHHNVLQCAPQGGLDGHLAPRLYLQVPRTPAR